MDRQLFQTFEAGAKTLLQETYDRHLPLADLLCTRIETTLSAQTYHWLGDVPRVRPFTDERAVSDPPAYKYVVENRKWESTIAVERAVFEYQQFGAVRAQIERLAEGAAQHGDETLADALSQGETGLCHDGTPFYGTDHPGFDGAPAAANKATLPLTAANLQSVLLAMQGRKTESGRNLPVTPTHLLVPPALRFVARGILATLYGNGAGNAAPDEPYADAPLRLLVSPYIASATEWHVFDLSRAVRPFLWQRKGLPELLSLDARNGETSESFLRDRYLYGVRIVDNVGYGLWPYAFKGNA